VSNRNSGDDFGKNGGRSSRELSVIIAAVLFTGLLAFVGGYFLGVRHGVYSFVDAHKSELLVLNTDSESAIVSEKNEESDGALEPVKVQSNEQKVEIEKPAGIEESTQNRRYWAIAATVESYVRATQLMEQAASVNIVVRIKKTSRLLAKGKKRILYQLVTPRYDSRQELTRALETLKTIPLWSRYLHIPIYKDSAV